MMINILFVCTGNICRSPMAELWFNDYCRKNNIAKQAKSAGVARLNDVPISKNAAIALADEGIASDAFRSSAVCEELIQEADIVYTMTSGHRFRLLTTFPQYSDKIECLMEDDVADPYNKPVDQYRKCLQKIKPALQRIADA